MNDAQTSTMVLLFHAVERSDVEVVKSGIWLSSMIGAWILGEDKVKEDVLLVVGICIKLEILPTNAIKEHVQNVSSDFHRYTELILIFFG